MAETEIVDASKGWGLEDFPLKHPFKFAGVEFRKFSFRVPSGAEIEAYIKSPDRGLRVLAASVVDADAKVLDAMHGGDYSRLMAELGKFVAGVR
ncbi:MAG: phage tail assembly protein [Roseiarcus sp.]|jgi:hypothetical protein